jgi:GNAT superfamily N-acetyltransferase
MPPPIRAAARFDIGYRPFNDGDLALIERLYVSTREAEVAQAGWAEDVQRRFLAQQFEAQHSHYRTHYADMEWLIIERAGHPIGRLYLFEDDQEFQIVDITVGAEARGEGIGTAILEDVFDLARPTGKRVSIHVEKNNPARRLYVRMGFVMVQDQGVYDLMAWSPTAPN